MDKNTHLTRNVICPHCGYEHLDSWEMDDGEYECDCGGSYVVERIITVEYSTYKVAVPPNEPTQGERAGQGPIIIPGGISSDDLIRAALSGQIDMMREWTRKGE